MNPADEALKYFGKKEIQKDGKYGNFGFDDPAFQKEMIEEGWHLGWAWCAIFAKVVFTNCFPAKDKIFDSLFSPSAVQTFNNFKKAGYEVSLIPKIGDLVIFQHYKNGVAEATGHAGIVSSTAGGSFISIEGNTSGEGVREGYIVGRNLHLILSKPPTGLRLLGFVTIS